MQGDCQVTAWTSRWAPEWAQGGTPDPPFLSPLLGDASRCASQSAYTFRVCMVCTHPTCTQVRTRKGYIPELTLFKLLPVISQFFFVLLFYSACVPNKGSTSPSFAFHLITSDEIPAHCFPVLDGNGQCLPQSVPNNVKGKWRDWACMLSSSFQNLHIIAFRFQ